ncbi:MAG: acetyl-CoA carboxylase biotin carboxyl carrier protein [Chloroflexota bacterium]
MPSPRQQPPEGDPRSPDARAADHAAIDQLADELVPALAAKLGATGLGEIEIREGTWRLRVRRPADGINLGRRASDRPSRSQPGHAGHGHAPGALEGHRAAARTAGAASAAQHSTNGSGAAHDLAATRPEGEPSRRRGDADGYRAIATSPAVGVYQPRPDMTPGTRVRGGDRLGIVDMLGVPQDVVSPVDGVVGASLVEPGEAVEYGQELIVVELLGAAGGTASVDAAAEGR